MPKSVLKKWKSRPSGRTQVLQTSLTALEPSEAEQDELLHVLNKLRALRGPGETRP